MSRLEFLVRESISFVYVGYVYSTHPKLANDSALVSRSLRKTALKRTVETSNKEPKSCLLNFLVCDPIVRGRPRPSHLTFSPAFFQLFFTRSMFILYIQNLQTILRWSLALQGKQH